MKISLRKALLQLKNPERAIQTARFFKTGKGEYGEGNVFIGLSNPQVQSLVKAHWKFTTMADVQELINDKIHELRFAALLVLHANLGKRLPLRYIQTWLIRKGLRLFLIYSHVFIFLIFNPGYRSRPREFEVLFMSG